jgi:uracil-DNA glycosylase family 4
VTEGSSFLTGNEATTELLDTAITQHGEPAPCRTCTACPLGGAKIKGNGPKKAKLVVVGEAPGRSEITSGVPFIGVSGQILDGVLAEHGLPRSQVYVTNVVSCRPTDAQGNDAAPNAEMVAACTDRLHDEIAEIKPKIILALGTTAAQRLAGTTAGITKVQGVLQWSDEFGCYVLPTYHPAAVLHGSTGWFDDIYFAVQRAVRFATGKTPIPPKYDPPWEFVRTGEGLERYLAKWLRLAESGKQLLLGIDTESHGPHDEPRPLDDCWDLFQIADDDGAYAFPTELLDHADNESVLRKLLLHQNIWWVMHNLQYDQQVFYANLGVKVKNGLDTMVLGLGLTERGEQVGLKAMSRIWLNAPYYEKELVESGLTWKTGPTTEAQWLALAMYGCYDAWNTRKLAVILPPLVREEGTMELCRGLLLPAQDAFADVSGHGTAADIPYADALEEEWLPIIAAAEEAMQDWAESLGFPADPKVVGAQTKGQLCDCARLWAGGHSEIVADADGVGRIPMAILTMPPQEKRKEWREHFNALGMGDPSCSVCMKRRFVLRSDTRLNVRSFLQLQHLAFDILHMRGPEGKRSCDDNFLEYNKASEFTRYLRDIREKDHLLRNYIRGISKNTWSDGRIHPDFLLFGTVTGRLSIHNPPMQTLPKWGVDPENAKLIRRMIRASDGHVIVDIDYKNLELFVAHHYSQDVNLLKALTEYDFHTFTAAGAFGKDYDKVTKLDRFFSKFITFGIAYGRQAYSLAVGELKDLTGGSEREAQKYVDRFWNTYPDYKRVYDQWQVDATTKGELRTPMGRVRRWRLIMPAMLNHIRNQAVNFPIQSLASDMCLSALIRLNTLLRAKGFGHVLFTVHDSLVFEIKEEYLDEAMPYIVKEMCTPPFESDTPFRVDIEVGPNLGDVHDYGEKDVLYDIEWAKERLAMAA